MPDANAHLKVGIFSALALVLLLAGIGLLAGGVFSRSNEDYTLYFEGSVAGLNVGAPVMFRGVPLGRVSSISLVTGGQDEIVTIPVGIDIFEERIKNISFPDGVTGSARGEMIAHLVARGLRARIATASYLTGQARVELDIYPETPARYRSPEPEHEIPTLPSPLEEFSKSLSRIKLEDIAHSLIQALENFNGVMGSAELKGSLSGIKRVTDEASAVMRETPALLENARKALERIETAADIGAREAPKIAYAMSAALNSFSAAAERVEELSLNASRLTAPGSATVRELQGAIRELAAAAQAVRSLAKTLERNPESMLRGRGRQ